MIHHVRKAISLNLLLSSSSMKCAWCTIVPWLCIVGATACRGGAARAYALGAAAVASNIFDRFLPTPAASGTTGSIVDLGRGFVDVNALRKFSIDDDVRVSRGIYTHSSRSA